MDGSGRLFDPLVQVLAEHPVAREWEIQVCAYPPDSVLDYARLEGDVRAVLPVNEPFVLLGESFSGPIAVSLAAGLLEAGNPHLKGVVLCCSFIRPPRHVPVSIAAGFFRLFPAHRFFSDLSGYFLFGRWITRPLLALLAEALAPVSPAVLSARISAVLSVDVSARLARCAEGGRLPLLYLQANQDRVVPSGVLKIIRQYAPAISVVRLSGPHCLLQTQPWQACDVLVRFVQDNAGK